MGTSNPGLVVTRADLRNPDLTVAAVMRTEFRSCNTSASASEVAAALRASGSPLLPVTRAQIPIGIVTEHDLAMALARRGGDLSGLTAGDFMSEQAPTIAITAPIEEAIGRLADAGGHLLVVDAEGILKGVVTRGELRPELSEAALGRLVARLDEGRGTDGSHGHGTPPSRPGDSPARSYSEPLPLVSPADLVNPMLTVADAMTADPRTCSPHSSALEAVMVFRDAGCGVVPVVEDGRPVGVLTDRDVALALAEHEIDLASRPVAKLMAGDVETIDADATLDAAIERLGELGLRRLLVVDSDGQLVGVLSWTDLVPHLSERGVGHVVGRIVGHR